MTNNPKETPVFRCTLCGLELSSPKPLLAWAHHYREQHAGRAQ